MKKNLLRNVGVLLLAAVLILLGANVVDYVRFTRAMARATGLTQDQLRAIGDRCRNVAKGQVARYKGKDIPEEFQPLKPYDLTLITDYAGISLYSQGELYLDFGVDTSPDNQHIFYFTNLYGPQQTTTLWDRDTVLTRKLSPDHRLITIMHDEREWIVLFDQIVVIDRPTYSGSGDVMLASTPLSAPDRILIEATIHSISSNVRGKVYRADHVVDGTHLNILFSQDGRKSNEDIQIENVWTDEAGPLLEVVSSLSPRDYPIEYKKTITEMFSDAQQTHPTTVRTLREWEAIINAPPKTPWWCVWPSLIAWNGSSH